MITRVPKDDILLKINDGLDDNITSPTEIVALYRAKLNRLIAILADLFSDVEKTGHFVFRTVVSPEILCLIRQCSRAEGYPFYDATMREFLTTGIVSALWTSNIYLDKSCVGIVLYSEDDGDQILEDHPDIKAKWEAAKKSIQSQ